MSRDAMDRAGRVGANERAVGADRGLMTPAGPRQHDDRPQKPPLDKRAERNTRLGFFGARDCERFGFHRSHLLDALARELHVIWIAFNPDEAPSETARGRA